MISHNHRQPNVQQSHYTYDGAGRLVTAYAPNGHVLSYGYSTSSGCAVGANSNAGKNTNRTSFTDATASISYSYCYDSADRLMSSTDPSVGGATYDSHGNTSASNNNVLYGHDSDNRHLTTAPLFKTALFVVGTPSPLSSTDQAMKTRLENKGWTVAVADDDGVTAAAANSKQLVVISDSVNDATVGNTFNSVAIPVLTWEPALFDNLGMTGTTSGTDYGTSASQTQVNVTNPGHPLAGGVSGGTTAVLSSSATETWGKPGSGAVVAATLTSDGSKATLFGYEFGATMVSGTAPARRIGVFINANTGTNLNSAGGKLFDAAAAWAAPTISYVRDATDRIVARQVNGITIEKYAYAGPADTPDATLDPNGTVIERQVALPGGVVLTKRTSNDVWSYPNVHGDIVATANSSGTRTSSVSYDPFGQALTAQPDNADGNFDSSWLGTNQRSSEHEPGLPIVIEMGSRTYSPALGRFLEVDPEEGGCANAYVYVFGDPINESDLTGRSARTCRRAAMELARRITKYKGVLHRLIRALRYRDGDPAHVAEWQAQQRHLQKAIRAVRQECRRGRGRKPPGPALRALANYTVAIADWLLSVKYPGYHPTGGSSPGGGSSVGGGGWALALVGGAAVGGFMGNLGGGGFRLQM